MSNLEAIRSIDASIVRTLPSLNAPVARRRAVSDRPRRMAADESVR
jgi:hypothetical protein